MGINPFCGHKSNFLRDNRFIAVITAISSSGHFGENAKGKPKIRHHFFYPLLLTARKDSTQKREDNPNHECQFPREHDNESANGGDTKGGKKPAEKPDKTRSGKERNCKRQKNQKNKHFIFPFHFMCLLYHRSRALSSPFLQKFRKFFDDVYCGRVNSFTQVPTIPNLFIIINQDGHVIAVAHAIRFCRAILDAVEVVIVEALFFKPCTLCFTHEVFVFLARIFGEPSDDVDFPALGAEKFANLIQFSHIAHGNGSSIGLRIFRTEKRKPIFDAVQVSNSAVHVKVDRASSGHNVGLDVSDFHKHLPLSFTVSVLYHTSARLSREILAISCFIYPFFPFIFGKLFVFFLPKTECDDIFYCVINREILVEKNKVLAKESSSAKEFAVRADNFIDIDE